MATNHSSQRSQLFTVRIWAEDLGNGRFEIRGQVKHVPSGESGYFRKWDGLISYLTQKLQIKEAELEPGLDHPGQE